MLAYVWRRTREPETGAARPARPGFLFCLESSNRDVSSLPFTAETHSRGFIWPTFHPHHHWGHGFGFGVGYVGGGYDGCYQTRRVFTPYGVEFRTVNVCAY